MFRFPFLLIIAVVLVLTMACRHQEVLEWVPDETLAEREAWQSSALAGISTVRQWRLRKVLPGQMVGNMLIKSAKDIADQPPVVIVEGYVTHIYKFADGSEIRFSHQDNLLYCTDCQKYPPVER